MTTKWWTPLVTIGFCATLAAQCAAQYEHRDRGSTKHRRGIRITTPVGEIVTDLKDYRFVVPSRRNQGSYYTHEDTHYYAPALPHGAPNQGTAQRPAALEFGAFQHHEELVERLSYLGNQLCLDLHHNYRGSSGFRDTYREAYQLWQDAKHLHEDIHGGDRREMQQTALAMDRLFHHVQDEVLHWRGSNQRQVGELPLPAKLEEIEAVLHHLLFDMGVNPEHGDDHNEVAPAPQDEVPPPPR